MSTPEDARVAAPGEPASDWERKRRSMLDGAARVFSERGYKQGTTKDIAAHAGLSQPALYHYVGSKADLLREIALQVDRDMIGALERATAASPRPTDQLRNLIHEFTRAVVDNRLTFAVYRQEVRSLEPEVADKVQADERAFVSAVERMVAAAQAAGDLPHGQPAVLTYGILNMVSEVHRWYRPDGPLDAESIADAFCDLIRLPRPESIP